MIRAVLIVAVAAAADAGGARAELLSSRPITIVIPFTPGASSDTLQRIVARKVSESTGQTIVVESRPGGSGALAAAAVKQALPDGHTLLQANATTHAVNAALYASLSYDPIRDFKPVTLQWSFPQLLSVPIGSPVRTVEDLVALGRSKPGGLSFASQGTGSGGHLLGEMLKVKTGGNLVHVPYRGAGPAAFDLAAGRVDFMFVSYSSVVSFLHGGKVRALAVSSTRRLPAMPDIPTMREVGYEGVELDAWFGLAAPAATPDAVIERLNAAFVQAVRDPAVVKQITDQGAVPAGTTAAEFARFIVSETTRFAELVRRVGVKGE